MIYLDKSNFGEVFSLVYKHYANGEQVPRYEDERLGVDKLEGIFKGVRSNDFYPTIAEKAVHIFTQINKGHFFSNGNKRLALVFSIVFLLINGKDIKNLSKHEFTGKLQEIFPKYKAYEDQSDFLAPEYALYNLSIIVADSHRYIGDSFDDVKARVNEFFTFVLR